MVIALTLMALLLMVALVSGGLVAVVATHRRIQAAADLAALAGAAAARDGADACTAVERIAAAHRTVVRDCAGLGPVVDVVVAAQVTLGPESWTLEARARAGPGRRPVSSPTDPRTRRSG